MLYLSSYKLSWYLQGHFLLANFDNHAAADAVQSSEEGQSPLMYCFTSVQLLSAQIVCQLLLTAELSDSSDDLASTCSDNQSDAGSSDDDSDVSIDEIITTMEDGLSLMERYPVLLNEKPPTSTPGQQKSAAEIMRLRTQLKHVCA